MDTTPERITNNHKAKKDMCAYRYSEEYREAAREEAEYENWVECFDREDEDEDEY